MRRGEGGGGEGQFDTPCGLSKIVSPKPKVKPWSFVTFKIMIRHVFPENFIEIPQVVQKLWETSQSILDILIDFTNFSDFLTFPCYKETNDANLKKMMSTFFHFQHTLNRLFNNCIKFY